MLSGGANRGVRMSDADESTLAFALNQLEYAYSEVRKLRDYEKGAWLMRKCFDRILEQCKVMKGDIAGRGPSSSSSNKMPIVPGSGDMEDILKGRRDGDRDRGRSGAVSPPPFCRARSSKECAYPSCGCDQKVWECKRSSQGGVPPFCQARSSKACAYPKCGCERARSSGGGYSSSGRQCQKPHCCQYPNCHCPKC